MIRFRIGIGQYEHRSEDSGTTWSKHLREVPARHAPIVQGHVDLARLPSRPNAFWDFVSLHPSGFGVAVDHQTIDSNEEPASIFVTADGGRNWNKRNPQPRFPVLSALSWPVERFASLALPSPGVVALAWEDPWLFDGPQSHVICSQDRGKSWRYQCLGYSNSRLGLNSTGDLLALNDGYYMESRDGGTSWRKLHFQVEWPERYDNDRVALLREPTFIAGNIGYALIVHWHFVQTRDTPPNVGLVTTTDNGMHWKHLHIFDGPSIGDINERHVLTLCVSS